MKKSLVAALALSGIGILAASGASAQCVWVSCPNTPPPQYQPQQNTYYPPQREVYREETRIVDNGGYNDGYRDGVRAASRTKSRANTGSSRGKSHVSRGHVSRGHVSRGHVYRSTGSSAGRASASRVVSRTSSRSSAHYSAPVKKQRVATSSVRRSTASYRAPVRQYSTSSHTSYQTNYVQPYRNSAQAYNAPRYGNSINIANYGGRGESWVSTNTQVVRYSTPHVISNVDGRSCGWGTQIAANGQMTGRQAFVCHCEQGWLPR